MLPQSALVVFLVHFFVCLRGIFCASYLPFVLSSMHGLLCFCLFGLSRLLLQIQFPFTIHPAHSSVQPCCLLLSLTHEYTCAHRGTSGHGRAGSSWGLGAGGLSGWAMAGPSALPSQDLTVNPANLNKAQSLTQPPSAHEEHKGQVTFSSSVRRLWSGIASVAA